MMNPELAALLGQGQTAPPSVAGSPVVSAIQKLMGAGGSAPPQEQPQGQQMAMNGPHGPAQTRQPGNEIAEMAAPLSTEEELMMAQKNMGASREAPPTRKRRGAPTQQEIDEGTRTMPPSRPNRRAPTQQEIDARRQGQ